MSSLPAVMGRLCAICVLGPPLLLLLLIAWILIGLAEVATRAGELGVALFWWLMGRRRPRT